MCKLYIAGGGYIKLKPRNAPNMRDATDADDKLGFWMSGALSDKTVCDQMKEDINNWFNSLNWAKVHINKKRTAKGEYDNG